MAWWNATVLLSCNGRPIKLTIYGQFGKSGICLMCLDGNCGAIKLITGILKLKVTGLKKIMMTSSIGNIFSVTGPLCGEFTGPGEYPTQRPVTRSFDVFFDLRLNKRLSKHSWGWWFETLSWSLWRHHNERGRCDNASGVGFLICRSNKFHHIHEAFQWQYISVMASEITGNSTIC